MKLSKSKRTQIEWIVGHLIEARDTAQISSEDAQRQNDYYEGAEDMAALMISQILDNGDGATDIKDLIDMKDNDSFNDVLGKILSA